MGDVISIGPRPRSVPVSDFIRKMNAADKVAVWWRHGIVTAVVATEHLVGLGFYDVRLAPGAIRASFNGVRFTLGE